jgi:PAS domain S-box-containing protein
METANQNGNGGSQGSPSADTLRASELSYRRLFEAAKDGILILDVETGRITDVNPFLLELLNFSRSEMLGKTVGELSPFKDIESNKLMLEHLQADGYVRYEDLPLETSDGRHIAVEFVCNVYAAGDRQVIQCNVRDITARKKSDEHLTMLSTCIAHLNEIVLVTEAEIEMPGPRIVFVNPAFERITGYAPAEAIGQSPRFLQGEKTDRQTLAEIHQALARGEPIKRQLLNYKKDGTEYWMDIDIVPVLDTAGKRTHFVAIERDITKRMEVESQLRWKTAFFEAQVNSSLDGIIVVNSEGKLVLQNRKMMELWNPPQEIFDELDHRKRMAWVAGQVVNPEQFAEKVAYLYAHPNEISRDELELVNGKHFDRYTAPVIGCDQEYFGRIWAYRDITERKQVEEKQRASEERYRTLFDCAPDGIVIANPTGVYIDGNASICRMLGYTRDELIGCNASHIVAQSEIPKIEGALIEIKKKSLHHQEWQFRRKDGLLFPAEVIVTPMPDGNLLGMIRDTSERKRSEEQIAEQATFLDKAQDAIFVRDLDGKMLFWNKGAERMYGWARQEVVNRKMDEFLYTQPKELAEAYRLTMGRGDWHGELRHLTKDGNELTIESRWTLIRDKEGLPKSVLAINTDITEKKMIEAQFMRAQRMESIGTLAGGIAHDLNNILAPIVMSIELLKQTSNDPTSLNILKTIEVSAKRGADVVRQVLSFARGLEGERIEVQLKHLLNEVQSIIKDTFPKNIRLQFSVPNDIWTILGDPTQVHQILLNLCVNARDAMPNGGSLCIDVENCVLDEHDAATSLQAKAGHYVNINVTDSGTGIPPRLLEKIFEPFFTTKGITMGTGLGLSTVMAIVKSHGGLINVYSELNKGTIFKVYLPAMEISPEARMEQLEQAALPRGNGETVLLVDDEASILTITRQTLLAFGYHVLTATDGAEAVGVYAERKNEIAVVLTDMAMPIMDGAATIRALTKMNPKLKIIAASGLHANDDIANASGVGIKHFLTKPYTAGLLLKTLRAILDEA